jgi:hypothetical protein
MFGQMLELVVFYHIIPDIKGAQVISKPTLGKGLEKSYIVVG